MTNDELDELVRRIHFSAASLDELTDQELYEYTDDTCQRVIDEAKQAIQQLIDEAYKKGYNDNSRNCYCDSPGATEGVMPHRHLMDDGESHDIRPDIAHLQSGEQVNE